MGVNRAFRHLSWVLAISVACVLPAARLEAQTARTILRNESIHNPVIGLHGMVVSQNDLASGVGRQILERGGNAVDAAVAIGFTLAVTLPRAGNLGGSGFILIHMADDGKTVAIDYRSAAPLASDEALFRDDEGKIDREVLTYGAKASAVPGTVAGLHEAWKRHGSLPWKELLEPARKLADEGFIVSHDLASTFEKSQPTLSRFPSSAAIYLRPDGKAWQPGERLVQKDLAWSLGQIKEGGPDAFYRGALSERIAEAFAADGGLITSEDLAGYEVMEREVVATDYRGYRVISTPPPSAGGVTLIQMLNMLSEFDLAAMGAGSVQSVHLMAEVMKRAAANRRTWLGDPDFVTVPVREYIDPAVAKVMASSIDLSHATNVKAVEPFPMTTEESRETTHYSVLDAQGNAVSNTYTIGYSFGSSWVAAGTGILFDNQMRNYSYRNDARHPNALLPKKRVLSTMTPTIVLDGEGRVFLVTGTPGGSYIINIILQILVNVIDHGMNIAEATSRPRMYQGWRTRWLGLERGFSPDVIRLLDGMGHETRTEPAMGGAQSIMWRERRFFGAADPRHPDATALGVMYPPQRRSKANTEE
jgi:gamma-glutamyltranspeptidase/glutathione hydrolase